MNNLTVIRGLPGSGKTTFAKTSFPRTFHVETDMFHIRDGEYVFNPKERKQSEAWLLSTIERALSLGMDVVTSCVYGHKYKIEALARLADNYGARFRVYRMIGDFGNCHAVPEETLKAMKDSFEDWEGEIKIYPRESGSEEN